MKKIAADLIATEMFRLLKKASEDNASVNEKNADEVHDKDMAHHDDMADDEVDDDMADDESDMADDLHSYLMDSVDDNVEDEVSYVDDEIDAMKGMAEDYIMRDSGSFEQANGEDGMLAKASDIRLMSGLGRIEASLRNKGEGFAADLVRATASSIKQHKSYISIKHAAT
jgi:hypothetical protein